MPGIGPGVGLRRGRGIPSPSLTFDASGGALPAGFTCTRASKAWYFDSTGTIQEAANDTPRFDYDPSTFALRGLLIEEQRTNLCTNPRWETAVAGTPGTWATAYGQTYVAPSGITVSIEAITTISGMPVFRTRFVGTPGASSAAGVRFGLTLSGITEATTYTGSVYARTVGTYTGPASARVWLNPRNSSNVSLTAAPTSFTPSSSWQRVTNTLTLPATSAQLALWVDVVCTSGQAIDVTWEFAFPQYELGDFATSAILPPAGTPAASTRNADTVQYSPIGVWYNQARGTFCCEFSPANMPASPTSTQSVLAIANGTAGTDFLNLFLQNTLVNWNGNVGGVQQFSLNKSAITWADFRKVACVYGANDFAFQYEEDATLTDVAGTVPTIDRLLLGRHPNGAAWPMNGWVRRLTYYPSRLSDAQLKALTA